MSRKIKNICVFGMGGIGGYFGGRIAHRMNSDKLGGELYFIARRTFEGNSGAGAKADYR